MSELVVPNSCTAELIHVIQFNLGDKLGGISPDPVPTQAIFPYVTVSEVHGSELESILGPSGLTRTIMQIGCWDKSHEAAWAMRYRVKDLLLNFKGRANTQFVSSVSHNVDTEFYDGSRSLHHHVTRLFIWWSR